MTEEIQSSRLARKRITLVALGVLTLVSFWPGGEIVQGVLSPSAYLIWVVVGIPALTVLVFGVNAYINVKEDKKRIEQGTDRSTGPGETGGEA